MDFHFMVTYESILFLLLPVLPCLFLLKKHYYTRLRHPSLRLPPGPRPWPVVGNLFCLGPEPHKSLAQLAITHGPVFRLRLGYQSTVVISSTAVAREVMLHHDAAFAGRNVQDVLTALGHNEASVVFLSPCPRWRHLRRICTTLIFSNSRLDARRDMRTKKVKQLISYIESCSNSGEVVSIGQVAFTTIINILSNTFFSIDMLDLSSDYGREFKELVRAIMEEFATPNVADFFPVLKVVDLQGGRRRVTALVQRMFKIFDKIIDTRVKTREEGESYEDKDVLDSLLTITQKEDNDFGRNEILHFLLDLFAGGADTTSSTIEWTMAELIRKPEKIKKAQAELQEVVGKGNPLEESHIGKLSYLNVIVKETLRLHPPTPCLVPRRVETDVELCGYTILKNSTILINIWAMGRDDKTWENLICLNRSGS